MYGEFAKTIKDGTNIVLPIVGGDADAVRDFNSTLKDEGYSVYLILNELDSGKAAKRAAVRFLTTGRFVDPRMVYEQYDKPTRAFEQMEKEGGFDGYQYFNNDVPFGNPPMERRAAFPGGAIPRGYGIHGAGNREDGTRNAGPNESEIRAAETTTAERGNQVAPDGGASSLPIDQSVGAVGEGSNTRLSPQDEQSYVNAGTRQKSISEKRAQAEKRGSALLVSDNEITSFIDSIISKPKSESISGVVAFGQVGANLAAEVKALSGGKVDIDGYYLELDANLLDHAYQKHVLKTQEMTDQAFRNLPYDILSYDDVIKVEQRKNGKTAVLLGKKVNGYTVIVEMVSKSRYGIAPNTIYTMSTDEYIKKYKNDGVQELNAKSPQLTPETVLPVTNNSIRQSPAEMQGDSSQIDQSVGAALPMSEGKTAVYQLYTNTLAAMDDDATSDLIRDAGQMLDAAYTYDVVTERESLARASERLNAYGKGSGIQSEVEYRNGKGIEPSPSYQGIRLGHGIRTVENDPIMLVGGHARLCGWSVKKRLSTGRFLRFRTFKSKKMKNEENEDFERFQTN